MCKETGCNKRPSFNYEGEKASYCKDHKKEGMIDVAHKLCLVLECNTRPNFNYEGEKASYCKDHKKEGMINVVSKTCIECNCNTQPNFNYEGQPSAYCTHHKKEGMINVVDKTCRECNTRPNFNYEGQSKAYCADHKKEGMINVVSKTCLVLECNTRPTFNYEGEKASYCKDHKKEGMINVVDKMCKTHLCATRVQEKFDGYCLRCYIYTYPENPVSRNYKTKEFAVGDDVIQNFPDYIWIRDKTVNGCSKRRPDLLVDFYSHILIIEIDENMHDDYDCSCENKRIMEISQDLGHRPIVFIRFNPDKYKQNGKTITSCWGNNKKGICVIKKTKKQEWAERLNALKEQIMYWSVNIPDKTIETVQLFYDN